MGTEKEISLLNMCFYILGKWKVMIIAAIIGGVLMGAVSYLNSYNNFKDSQLAAEVDSMSAIDLTEEEIKALEAKIAVIKEYEENIAEYDYYLENSIKVKMNPNKFYQGSVNYFCEAEDAEDSASIAKAKSFCENAVSKETNFEELSLLLDEETDATLIKEVVSFSKNDENGEFSIIVEHYDQDECKIMLDFFEEKMEVAGDVLRSQGIPVNIQKISLDIKTCNDFSLVELSNGIKTKRAAAYDNISALETKMTDAQKAYYMLKNSEDETKAEDAETTNMVPKQEVNIKLAVVGAIMGVFFVFCLYGALYVFSNRVHTKEEMESWLSIPVYEYEVDSERKVNFIDSALASLKNMLTNKSAETPEMIAQMIVNTAKQTDAKKLYLTGSVENLKSEVIKSIMTLVTTEGLEVTMGSSILNDAKSFQMAVDCGYIVFMEKCNASRENDIRLEIAKANTCGIKVLGVILEG